MRLAGILDAVGRAQKGAVDAFGEGREDNRRAFVNAREDRGIEAEAPRAQSMFGQNRTLTMLREMIGVQPKTNPSVIDKILKADPYAVEARRQMGMEMSSDPATRVGQVFGHLGADLVQDRSREAWWLLNAPQAVGNVLNEAAISMANPNVFNKMVAQTDSAGNYLTMSSPEAVVKGAIDERSGRLKKGWGLKKVDGEDVLAKRKYNPGNTLALGIPVGLAINSGIGLMNPTGGQEGYQAAIPSDENKSKTDNALAEVASKYILGRTGNMLPWSEFQKVRPDVTKDEYMRYKAFKFDKDGDMNPFDDGQMTLPSGVLKYNNDGIHGAEVQFLGRSLPLHTAILPAAMAIGGTALGARRRFNKRGDEISGRPIRDGFIGGMSGAIGGMAIGNAIEDERRRRNAAENQLDTIN